MTSFTATFTGTSSVLQADFFPEIVLDSQANYCCALLDFTAYNSIPNIIKGENNELSVKYTTQVKKWNHAKKDYEYPNLGKEKTISLPTGAYEVEDLLKYLKWEFHALGVSLTYEISAASSTVGIEFDKDIEWIGGTLLNVLGFYENKTFEKSTNYSSENIVKITNVDLIRVECDIISGSYINGNSTHTIHQFSHSKVDAGYKFIEIPQHLIYFPIRENQLRSIQISIVDQNGQLIDFRGEQISCRIHIKKVGE